MKKADEIELARVFLDHAYALVESGDDTIYELLDPGFKYGVELAQSLNVYTVREILALGFKAKYGEDWHEPVRSRIDCALASPPRNCEVGTAMEQGERFSAYCRAHKHPESECLTCPIFGQTGGHCELAWAQLPYEKCEKEGVDNGSK